MSTASGTARRAQLDGLLGQLATQIPGVAHAVAVSGDGLVIACTPSLAADRADQFAAVVSGMVGLAAGAANVLELGAVTYNMQVFTAGVLVVQAVADGSSVAALALPDCDTAAVAYGLAVLADQIGSGIAAQPRPAG